MIAEKQNTHQLLLDTSAISNQAWIVGFQIHVRRVIAHAAFLVVAPSIAINTDPRVRIANNRLSLTGRLIVRHMYRTARNAVKPPCAGKSIVCVTSVKDAALPNAKKKRIGFIRVATCVRRMEKVYAQNAVV